MTITHHSIDPYAVHRTRLFDAMSRELDGTDVEMDALSERAYTRFETVGITYRRRKGDCIGFQVHRPQR